MITIAFLINYMKNEGPCNVVRTILNGIDKERFKPILITMYANNDERIINQISKEGIEHIAFNYSNIVECLKAVPKALEEAVVEKRIDIIHSHTFASDYVSALTKTNAIKISTVHNRTLEDYSFLYGPIKGKLAAYLHIINYRKLDLCVCCSKSVYEYEKKHLKKVSFIQNGVPRCLIATKYNRHELGIPEKATVFVYVGSLSKRKNVPSLVKLFIENHEQDDYLIILGDGEDRNYCKTDRNNNVINLGFVNDPVNYYSISDVYISNSMSEGLSLSQLESLSCGLAQLVSDIPSHREAVYQDSSYYVGEVFSPSDFREKKTYVKNKLLEKEINAIGLFERYFSDNIMCKKYERVYTEVTNGKQKI